MSENTLIVFLLASSISALRSNLSTAMILSVPFLLITRTISDTIRSNGDRSLGFTEYVAFISLAKAAKAIASLDRFADLFVLSVSFRIGFLPLAFLILPVLMYCAIALLISLIIAVFTLL